MTRLIEKYVIPGIKEIAIDRVEIYYKDGKYFARFKNGLYLTVPRDSLDETRIKMLKGIQKMLVSEKNINQEKAKEIDKGLEYITKELKNQTQRKVGGNK